MARPHRILFTIINYYPHGFGGGQQYVSHLAKELRQRGYAVAVVTLLQQAWQNTEGKKGEIVRYVEKGIDVFGLSIDSRFLTQGEKYAVNHPLLRSMIKDVMQEFSPDLIHLNGMNTASFTVASELGIPTIATIHHSGIACPAGALMYHDETICPHSMHHNVCIPCCSYQRIPQSRLLGFAVGKIPRWLYMPFGKLFDTEKKMPLPFRVLHYPWLVEQEMEQLRLGLNIPHTFIAPSDAIKMLLVRNGVSENRIRMIPHGVSRLTTSPIAPFDGRPVRFGYVSHIGYIKGFHILTAALEKVSETTNCELHVYGDTDGNEYYTSAVKRYNGKAKIVPHGFVQEDHLQQAYNSFDVLILPSLAHEAFGLVVNEALAAGRPVIVSNSGALPELVKSEYGMVVERNNVDALTQAMQRCAADPQQILAMSGRIPAVKKIDRYVDEIENLYANIGSQ
ncbi:MAG: glycosyltransferase [Bacteroidota bacterium]